MHVATDEYEIGGFVGQPSQHELQGFIAAHADVETWLSPAEGAGLLADALGEEAHLADIYLRPPGAPRLPAPPPDVVPLPADQSLAHLDAELREELEWARTRRTIWTAWDAGLPVSFAYCLASTARFGDISIDTLERHRRRGLATRTVLAVIAEIKGRGLVPVWGSLVTNAASQGLAKRLGFTAHQGRIGVIDL